MTRVPEDYTTVQQAIDAASDAEEIVIGEGNHVATSALVIGNKSLTLSGRGPRSTWLISQGFQDTNAGIRHDDPAVGPDKWLRLRNLSVAIAGPLEGTVVNVKRPSQPSSEDRNLMVEHVTIDALGEGSYYRTALVHEHCWNVRMTDVLTHNQAGALTAGVVSRGRCVGAKYEEVVVYDAENADAFRVEGPNAEGHVWVDCSSPQCRRGIVVELPLSELGQPSPGWVIRNFHADAFNTPVFLQNVAQFVVEGLLYRTTTATDIWDGLALVGTCRQGRVNVDFVNNSANNGPARAGESCGIWGVVNYAALNDVDITARGGALFQVVRLQSGARYDNVHDCRATNLIAGGVVVKNLSGYASPPDMVLRDNY